MTDQVERVARAIDPDAWDKHFESDDGTWNRRRLSEKRARDAIAAMDQRPLLQPPETQP